MAPTSAETRRVTIAEGVRVYTGAGHAPFKAGRTITMRADHAAALAKTGHVHINEAHPAAAAEPVAAEELHAEPHAAQAAPGPASESPAPHPQMARPGGPGVAPTAAR